MKILIPILSFGKGGGNRVLSELANNWMKLGNEVSFLCLDDSSEPYFPTTAKIYWVDVKGQITEKFELKKHRSTFSIFKEVIRLKRGMSKLAEPYDIVLANQALTSISVYLTKMNVKKYYYIQANEAGYSFYNFSIKNFIMGLIVRTTYKLPLTRVVNSPIYFQDGDILAKHYIPPAVDFSKFYPGVERSETKFVLGCVGRLEKFKGTLDVYLAFKILRNRGFDAFLYVAYGDINNYEVEYREFIKISFPKNDYELGQFYRKLNVLISPGTVQFYAHHYPVMEAMASKVPVITTGYLPADRSNSWIVGPYSPEQIVDSVLEISRDTSLVCEKTELAYRNIQYYKWDTISRDFLKLFENNGNSAR